MQIERSGERALFYRQIKMAGAQAPFDVCMCAHVKCLIHSIIHVVLYIWFDT